MKIRRSIGFAVALLAVLPASAMTVEEFAQKAAGLQEDGKVENVLAALPHGTDVHASLTEGAVVQIMGALGVNLRTGHPESAFSDDAVDRLLTSRAPVGPEGSREHRRKPRSKSPRRPHPPHGRHHGQGPR